MDRHEWNEGKSIPKFYEAVIITFVTICFTLVCILLSETFFDTSQTRLLTPWFIHLPLFMIPFIWYEYRLKPALPSTYPHLFRWPRKSTRLFFGWIRIIGGRCFFNFILDIWSNEKRS